MVHLQTLLLFWGRGLFWWQVTHNSVSKPNKLIGSPSWTWVEHLGLLVSSLGQIDTSLCLLGKIMGQLNWT